MFFDTFYINKMLVCTYKMYKFKRDKVPNEKKRHAEVKTTHEVLFFRIEKTEK